MRLTAEKLAQAQSVVERAEAGAWMLFVRETFGGSDPALPLVLDGGLTWTSALIVTPAARVAVVGNYDAPALEASGDWDEVVPYVQDIAGPLVETLRRLVPEGKPLALGYSVNDPKADGLSHGLWLLLAEILAGTEFAGRLVSAEDIVGEVRGVKTPEELARICRAIESGDGIFARLAETTRVGDTERDVFDRVHAWCREQGLGFSWDPEGDPIVNSGPDSMVGHGKPSAEIRVAPGHIFHVDLGVLRDGYSSDVQRCWYVPAASEDGPPEDAVRALAAVNAAITAGAQALRPGVLGWEVDAAARKAVQSHGYPEYLHALGHQVGRAAHDGGAVLGPRWPRYGKTPTVPVRAGEVYTLELGVDVPGRGYLGIEEMVVVEPDGCRFLTDRQTVLPSLRAATR
jgi:Xaa-Pro dipeptidase